MMVLSRSRGGAEPGAGAGGANGRPAMPTPENSSSKGLETFLVWALLMRVGRSSRPEGGLRNRDCRPLGAIRDCRLGSSAVWVGGQVEGGDKQGRVIRTRPVARQGPDCGSQMGRRCWPGANQGCSKSHTHTRSAGLTRAAPEAACARATRESVMLQGRPCARQRFGPGEDPTEPISSTSSTAAAGSRLLVGLRAEFKRAMLLSLCRACRGRGGEAPRPVSPAHTGDPWMSLLLILPAQ